MDEARLRAWMEAASILLSAGAATFSQIRGLIAAMNPDVTDEDLNAVIRSVQEDAQRRKEIAERDARGQ